MATRSLLRRTHLPLASFAGWMGARSTRCDGRRGYSDPARLPGDRTTTPLNLPRCNLVRVPSGQRRLCARVDVRALGERRHRDAVFYFPVLPFHLLRCSELAGSDVDVAVPVPDVEILSLYVETRLVETVLLPHCLRSSTNAPTESVSIQTLATTILLCFPTTRRKPSAKPMHFAVRPSLAQPSIRLPTRKTSRSSLASPSRPLHLWWKPCDDMATPDQLAANQREA